MPSLKNVLLTSARRAGYLDLMSPLPLPEPIPLLQATSMDTVMAALVAVPQELRQKPELHLVMLRERRRLLLLESDALRQAFPVAIGMPGWEPHHWSLQGAAKKFRSRCGCIRCRVIASLTKAARIPSVATGLVFTVIAVAVMPMTVINGSRLRAAPARALSLIHI